MSKKNGKKSTKKAEVSPYPNDLLALSVPDLREQISSIHLRLAETQQATVFMRVERDAMARQLNLLEEEGRDIDMELFSASQKIQISEEKHQRELKVYEHRMLSLTAEAKERVKGIDNKNASNLKRTEEIFNARDTTLVKDRQEVIVNSKAKINAHEQEVLSLRGIYEKNLVKLRENFEAQLGQLKTQLEEREKAAIDEADLRLRIETHQLEESKNEHIAQLTAQHEEAFEGIKQYYRDITKDNTEMVKKIQDEIISMRHKEKESLAINYQLSVENKNLTEPLLELQSKRDKLIGQLKVHTKNVANLKNLRQRSNNLEAKVKDTKKRIHRLDDKLRKVEKEKDEHANKFDRGIQNINDLTSKRNIIIKEKIALLEKTVKTTNSVNLGAQVRDEQFNVQKARKQHNDTHRVLEAKLKDLQLECNNLGPKVIGRGLTSTPAGLVKQ